MLSRLLDEFDVADLLRIDVRSVQRLIDAGEISRVQLPDGTIRFLPTDVWGFAESRRIAPATQPEATCT